MVAGGLVVAGLVGWALTRSVEPPLSPAASGGLASPQSTPATQSAPATSTLSPGAFSISDHGTQEPDKAQITRIAAEDLHAKQERGEVTIIDVRDAKAYSAAHIPGSLSIPMASIQTQLATLPKDKPIVTYCT